MSAFIAALPMYDRPECRAQTDAAWTRLRHRLCAAGIDAPDDLTREVNDLHAIWRSPKLLFAQTCWGPMEQGLSEHVHVLGQPDYSAYDGGEGESYSSVVVMRREGAGFSGQHRSRDTTSDPPDISPTRGEIMTSPMSPPITGLSKEPAAAELPISPLVGEMPGKAEGGVKAPHDGKALLPLDLMRAKRFAYNGPDSMSGLLALSRDLQTLGESIDIFSTRLESGAHRLSAMAVAEGRADVCAIDCRSWAMIRRYDAFADRLVAVGWTRRRKGLPFICSRAIPDETVALLRRIVADEPALS